MAVLVKSKKGKEIYLLNPSEKAGKFASELKHNVRFTNAGEMKTDDLGEPLRLTDTQRAYRSGYLTSRTDGAKVYKAKRKRKKRIA
ncbi:MAG TPA: hypothetical protein PLP48_00325 [Acholeplasmataceae bacterium]|nr:hypothetical protein [Acholeplasmataceae bacterium]